MTVGWGWGGGRLEDILSRGGKQRRRGQALRSCRMQCLLMGSSRGPLDGALDIPRKVESIERSAARHPAPPVPTFTCGIP